MADKGPVRVLISSPIPLKVGMRLKTTGMTRKVDDLGRIVLPIEIRRTFNIIEGDLLEISVSGENVILSKIEDYCIFCGSDADLISHQEKLVCLVCCKTLGMNV